MSTAIAGSDVAMTVESMFSMNRATARMSGMMRFNERVRTGQKLCVGQSKRWKGGQAIRKGGYHASGRMSH
jgi:hypothetical protein